MNTYPAGARIEIDAGAQECVVNVSDGPLKLAAASIVTMTSSKSAVPNRNAPPWRLPIDTKNGAVTQIVIYMTDDMQIGKVEEQGPITLSVGEIQIQLDTREDRHGAVIVAEIYERNGKRMLRVRGDGHRHGITALCRREGIPEEVFIARPSRGRTEPRPRPRESYDDQHAIGSGSGVIISPNHVITNAHVVRGSRSQTVHTVNGEHDARVISVDEGHDLALLHVPGMAGIAVSIEATGSSYLGEEVMAAGYPLRDLLNDDLKITRGNISSLRGLHGDVATLQFTAPIASGSSGGAVVSMRGGLAGVVCSALSHQEIQSRGGTSEGVNFAVKASLVLEMLAAAGVDNIQRTKDGEAVLTPHDLSRLLQKSVVAITLR